MFEKLDLNKNGKIDPREIDESLEDQIKPRIIKGNLNHIKMKLIVLSSLFNISQVSTHCLNFYIFIISEAKKNMKKKTFLLIKAGKST